MVPGANQSTTFKQRDGSGIHDDTALTERKEGVVKMRTALIVLLVLALPGCFSLKAGRQSFAGSSAGPATNGFAVDVEGHAGTLTRTKRLDWSFFFGYTRFVNDTGIPADGGGAYPSENLDEADFGLLGRVYPLGLKAITPYVGGGLGFFRLNERSRRYTGTCPSGPGWTCRTYVIDQEAIARGVFWKGNVGVLIPVTSGASLVIEFQRDGSKSDGGFVLDADRLVIGWRTGTRR